MSTQQPHEAVWALSTGGVAARCMQVVADLGVADSVTDQPVPVTELASSCHADPDALDRVLRLPAAHGVFERRAGAYCHTPSSRLLCNDHPMSMRAFVSMMELAGSVGPLDRARARSPHRPRRSRRPNPRGSGCLPAGPSSRSRGLRASYDGQGRS